MKLFRAFGITKEVDRLQETITKKESEICSLKEELSSTVDEVKNLTEVIENIDREQILLKEALESTTKEVKYLKEEIHRLVSMTKKK